MATTKQKNLCAKTRNVKDPYEIWVAAGGWQWRVLKKWQIDDDKPGARWFCAVMSPHTYGDYEYGDVWVGDIKRYAVRTYQDPAIAAQ